MQEIISNPFKYCNSLTDYSRYKTREVFIGDVAMGGKNPIRIQSMTTTDTMDTIGTVEQSIRIFEAGGEYVRITAPSKKEAHNLAEIKKELKRRGYDIPLIADIHFTPNAAEIAARIVEKVRVNPGNYADKKKFNIVEYSDADYQAEIERIYERFAPLVKICKEEGTAMRVGTNHGSLSDRIMSRYGDTPIGMVESALEFVRICEDLSYHNIVLSMKASNPQVMIQAYRLLMNKMEEENMNYPIHLGVTEAGDGLDGRIKSAVGIGAMLEDGIGDTVRVSLTEAPEAECPVAIDLVNRYIEENRNSKHSEDTNQYIENSKNVKTPIEYKSTYKAAYNPFEYRRRKTVSVEKIGGDNVPIMIADFGGEKIESAAKLLSIGYDYSDELDKWNIADQAADFLYLGNQELDFEIPGTLQKIYDYDYWSTINDTKGIYPLMDIDTYMVSEKKSNQINFVSINVSKLDTDALSNLYTKILNDKTVVLIVESEKNHWMADIRGFFVDLLQNKIQCPVVLKKSYPNIDTDKATLYSSTDFGALLIDGLGDGIWMGGDADRIDRKDITEIVFGILQSTRTRISKTEYISCPSCGRTLFDLEETTAMIRKRTHHLKGVKIGIMGCIVNGPGEMADADYGYVGSGIDKITLYRGQEVVKRAVPTEHAVDELIELIREDGNWVDM